MMWRTRSAKISAPPPGSESTPAAFSCSSVSANRKLGALGQIRDLDHGEGFEVHLRKALLQPGNQIEKILERQIRMQSADDVKLRDRLGVAGSGGLECLFQRHGVGAGSVLLAPESAQPAGGHANVRGIDVAVDVEVSLVAVHAFAHVIGQPADGENVAGAVEREGVGCVEAFAGKHLGVDRLEARVVGLKGVSWGHPLDDTARRSGTPTVRTVTAAKGC